MNKNCLLSRIIIYTIMMGLSFSGIAQTTDAVRDSKQITTLVKSVYKEKIKKLIKYKNKESQDKLIIYYEQFFTDNTSSKLANRVIRNNESSGDGAFLEDPRYSDRITTGDPEDPWILETDRIIKRIIYHNPITSNTSTTIDVDSIVESNHGKEMRSRFYLVRTPRGWRIENIVWGPKGEFLEGSTQALRSLSSS